MEQLPKDEARSKQDVREPLVRIYPCVPPALKGVDAPPVERRALIEETRREARGAER